jgi:hypothetical protein
VAWAEACIWFWIFIYIWVCLPWKESAKEVPRSVSASLGMFVRVLYWAWCYRCGWESRERGSEWWGWQRVGSGSCGGP